MKKIKEIFKKIYSALFYKEKNNIFERKLGWIPDPKDSRDVVLGNYLIPQKLPQMIDWADTKICVKNQIGPSCVGYSSAGMKEIQEELEHNKILDFDGLKLYQRCKELDGYPGEGTYIRVVMKIMEKEGAPLKSGEKYKIASYTRLNTIEEMKFALTATGPFVAGVNVYENFTPDEKGLIPMPQGNFQGGHAILITGYDDNSNQFHFKNSWGSDWGNNGYAYLSYDFISKHCDTAWAGVDLKDEVTGIFIDTKKLKSAVKEAKNARNSK